MLLGYAGLSADEQTTRVQLDALRRVACDRIFLDTASSTMLPSPIFDEVISQLRSGDTLVVWSLDRLATSLHGLIEVVQQLEMIGADLRSLIEGVDSSTSDGRLVFRLLRTFASFDRDPLEELKEASLAAALAQRRKVGRPRKLNTNQVRIATRLLENPRTSVSAVAQSLGVHRATLYRALHSEHGAAFAGDV